MRSIAGNRAAKLVRRAFVFLFSSGHFAISVLSRPLSKPVDSKAGFHGADERNSDAGGDLTETKSGAWLARDDTPDQAPADRNRHYGTRKNKKWANDPMHPDFSKSGRGWRCQFALLQWRQFGGQSATYYRNDAMPITLSPIRPGFGAEVSGIDISQPMSDANARAIVQAIDDYSVLVFRNTCLDDAAHVRFSEIFGYVERYPTSIQKVLKGEDASHEGAPAEYGAFINGITNMTADGRISDDPERRILFAADRYWHTDSSFIKQRAGYSALLAHVVPPEGGLTWFADLRAAYDDLSPEMKTRIEGLEAEHCMWWSRILGGYAMSEEMAMRMPAAAHPIVHTLRSGRKSLYLASHARAIVGMDPQEGRALLAELTAFATRDKYIFSVSWQPGDLVVWSNLATLHRGGGFDELKHKRNMRRTTIRASPAPDHDDQPHLEMYRRSLAIMGRSAEVVN